MLPVREPAGEFRPRSSGVTGITLAPVLSSQGAEQARGRSFPVEVAETDGEHQTHRCGREALHQEVHQGARVTVAPLQIVDQEHDRCFVGQRQQQLRDRLEEP